MTKTEKAIAWCWDNLPGGLAMQLWLWARAPRVADFCEALANERDKVEEGAS